jgi:hypothetical protein
MSHILIASGYFLVVVVAVAVEHRYLSRLPELVRRGIGGCTVLAPAFLLALLGALDLWTWLVIAAGFVAAGGTLTALVMVENKGNGGDDGPAELGRKIEKLTQNIFN